MSDDAERLRDERLAAWLDGALPPAEAEAFAAELEADPTLAARAANWQANDRLIADAFAPIAAAPIDPALLAKLGLAEPALPLAANDNPPWWRRHALPLGGAIAASLAAVLLLIPRGAPGPQDAVSLALETTLSGQAARLADGRSLTPMLTLRAADGRWCREYRLGDSAGLACRDGTAWKVEAEAKQAGPAPSGGIVLAGGEGGSPLDPAHARLGTSDPLDLADEAALIQNNWGGR
jgi:hypothetical protein